MTTDVDAAKKFYRELLGWETEDMSLKDMTYSVIKAKDYDIGGIMGMPPGQPVSPPAGCLM